jgi:DNA-3-methyladenine glycosylase
MAILPRDFYLRPTIEVARALLGQTLIRDTDEGPTGGVIVETEAYLSAGDLGSHAARGHTPRNEVMFGSPGHVYVYRIHQVVCMNLITAPEGVPEAVLIRALEPTLGVELMRRLRGRNRLGELCSGPGKLCQALGVRQADNGRDITRPPLCVCVGQTVAEADIVTTTRIGLSAGKSADLPLRFYLAGNRYVSRR